MQDDLTATRGDITALGVCSDNQVAQFVPAAGAERYMIILPTTQPQESWGM